jgi:hypothetical protein
MALAGQNGNARYASRSKMRASTSGLSIPYRQCAVQPAPLHELRDAALSDEDGAGCGKRCSISSGAGENCTGVA